MILRLCGAFLGVLIVLGSLATASDVDEPDVDLTLVGGGSEFTNSIGMKFVRVRAGKFTMGAPKDEQNSDANEKPQHPVELTRDYYLAVHEVTQKQYKAIMGKNPAAYSKDGSNKAAVQGMDTDDFPVEEVSWNDTQEFCKKLNALAAEARHRVTYRLPSEAEWEFACRGGMDAPEPFNLAGKPSKSISSDDANFEGTSPYGGGKVGKSLNRPAKVGSYKPNRLGVYDMHGNVWEWCHDVYAADYYTKNVQRDPTGPKDGTARVFRGASFVDGGYRCRAAFRYGTERTFHSSVIGFRVAASPQ